MSSRIGGHRRDDRRGSGRRRRRRARCSPPSTRARPTPTCARPRKTWTWRKAEYDRAQSLAASKVMSAADLDEKKAQYEVAVARWEKAKTLRDYTVIRAPFAGVVTEKYARVGQKVIEDKNEPLFKITAVEPLLARVYLPEEELLRRQGRRPGRGRRRALPGRPDDRRGPVHQPDRRRRRAARSRSSSASGASRRGPCCGPGSPSRSASPRPRPADGAPRHGRWPDRPRSSARLRSTLDRVLVHDIKNMSFRLRLLLSNLDEHWEDPEFRRTVRDLLASTVERLEDIVGRFAAHEDAVLDQGRARRRTACCARLRRGRRARGRGRDAAVRSSSRSGRSRGSGATPSTSATPSRACSRTRSRPRAPRARCSCAATRPGPPRRPRAIVEIIDNGAGMTPEFLRDRLFRPFETTKPEGVGLGLATASQIVRFHRGRSGSSRSRAAARSCGSRSRRSRGGRMSDPARPAPRPDRDRGGRPVPRSSS